MNIIRTIKVATARLMAVVAAAGYMASASASQPDTLSQLPGSGTAADPFVITSAAHLRALAAMADSTAGCKGHSFRLGADVCADSTFRPVALFNGSFEGAGHTLTYNYAAEADSLGLFRVIGRQGVVRNLVLAGSLSANRYAGALAAECQGLADSITNRMAVSAKENVGGVAAVLSGSLTNCVNGGVLRADAYVGGIACKMAAGGLLANCRNEADILLPEASNIGGIISYTTVNASSARLLRCVNTRALRGCESPGGISSRAESGLSLDSCVNSGTVAVSGRYGAGIVAQITGNPVRNVQLTACSNSGAIISPADYLGGIAAFTTGNVTLSHCVNTGAVTHSGSGAAYIGGLCGMSFGNISHCANAGVVSAPHSYAVGGLVGAAQQNCRINCSYNVGAVSASATALDVEWGVAGGLAGDVRETVLSNSYNLGVVSAYDNAAGLCGMIHNNCALRYSYNAAAVQAAGTANVGAVANLSSEAATLPVTTKVFYDADVCLRLSAFDREYAVGYATAEMCQNPPSERFDSVRLCYPLLTDPAPLPEALMASLCVSYDLPGDNASNVNGAVFVGVRPGIDWHANRCFGFYSPGIYKPLHTGLGTLTASCRGTSLSRTFSCPLRSYNNGAEVLLQPIRTQWHTLTGLPVTHPAPGTLYLRTDHYPDGTARTTKALAE